MTVDQEIVTNNEATNVDKEIIVKENPVEHEETFISRKEAAGDSDETADSFSKLTINNQQLVNKYEQLMVDDEVTVVDEETIGHGVSETLNKLGMVDNESTEFFIYSTSASPNVLIEDTRVESVVGAVASNNLFSLTEPSSGDIDTTMLVDKLP